MTSQIRYSMRLSFVVMVLCFVVDKIKQNKGKKNIFSPFEQLFIQDFRGLSWKIKLRNLQMLCKITTGKAISRTLAATSIKSKPWSYHSHWKVFDVGWSYVLYSIFPEIHNEFSTKHLVLDILIHGRSVCVSNL